MQTMLRFRNCFCVIVIFLTGVFLSACSRGTVSPSVPNLQTIPVQKKSGTIRFGTFSTPNASSMSWLMALEKLKEEGYTVETTVFASL